MQLQVETADQGRLVVDAPRDSPWRAGDAVGLRVEAHHLVAAAEQ